MRIACGQSHNGRRTDEDRLRGIRWFYYGIVRGIIAGGDLACDIIDGSTAEGVLGGNVAVVAYLVGVGLFWVHALARGGFLLLDYVNLPFHEFGHLFFGFLGPTLGLWGGTIAQLTIPLVILVAFARQGQSGVSSSCAAAARSSLIGIAFGAFWFGESLLNVSWYIADAQVMELPLVGGGEHDWNIILSGLHLVDHCRAIAWLVKALGWTVMIASTAWLILVTLVPTSSTEK